MLIFQQTFLAIKFIQYMYSRLKKHRMKTREKVCRQQTERSCLLNFPVILNKQQTHILKPQHFKPITREQKYFPSHKKISKPELYDHSSSSYAFPNLQRSFSRLYKDRKNQNNLNSLNISTKNWCLYDSNNHKYFGFRQDYKRQVASLTKIMTTYLSLQIIELTKLSLNCKIKVTNLAASIIGTSAQLKSNQWISIQDLLYGIMLPSGNDAAFTLAEYIGYILVTYPDTTKGNIQQISLLQKIDLTGKSTSVFLQQFICLMNIKAKKLGMKNTRFSNPHGLQNAMNVSSAKDIIILSAQVTKNQQFKKIMNSIYWKYCHYQTEQFRKKTIKKWWNTNKLLYKDWQGIKTGQTGSAGSCLASLKQGIYIVVLNSSNSELRFLDTQKLFEWYLQKSSQRYNIGSSGISLIEHKRAKTDFNCLQILNTEDSI